VERDRKTVATLSDLRTVLIAGSIFAGTSGEGLESQAGRIQSNKNDEGVGTPRIFLQTTSPTEIESFYNGATALTETRIDLEVISINNDEVISITAAVKRLLSGYYGAFGSGWALGVKVEDHDDQYTPLNADSDEGENVAALRVLILA